MKFFALAMFAIAAATPAHAIEVNAGCGQPQVFPDARVNAIVLPYSNPDIRDPELERAASQLTLLLEETILFSALKYPSVAAVRMLPLGPVATADCQPGVIAQKILGQMPGAIQKLRPDGTAILLWGRIYREGNQIYLCSYARILRNGANLPLESSGGGHGIYYAALPADAIAFPARVITTDLLAQVATLYRNAATVHRDRDLNSPGTPLPTDPKLPMPYTVLEATPDGWMHVRSMHEEVSGWIHANDAMRSPILAANLPELKFVDGAIGYLETAKSPNPTAIAAAARPSLQAFAEAGTRDTTLATATAKSMLAILLARDAPGQGTQAYSYARDAVTLVPYNADARNLELVLRLERSSRDILQPSKWQVFADELAQAAALGPDKPYILDNLDKFYAAALATPGLADSAAKSDIARRRGLIGALRGR